MGPSMDSQIITVLFNDVIKAAQILGKDREFSEKLKEILKRLPEPEIGKYGQIKEWAVDYDEVEIGHRHISHLFALYPADLITPEKDEKLAKAARATLERRLSHGGGHTGWSRAWITNMWARLYDGEKVYENLKKLLRAQFPTLREEFADQLALLFGEIRKKCESAEISTKALDLRGLLASVSLVANGLNLGDALDLGIVNKSFDDFERQLVHDILAARIDGSATRTELFAAS